MEAIHAKMKKWGNSMGIVIPRKAVEDLHLRENQDVAVLILQKTAADILKGLPNVRLNLTGQQAKDIARRDLWN